MRIAMPVWSDRISPVLDVARELVLVDIKRKQVMDRKILAIDGNRFSEIAYMLNRNNVDIVLCGALSDVLFNTLRRRGIRVQCWLTGEIDDILDAFISGRLRDPRYRMPGCFNHPFFRR
jgi:predicted Fe-Mo cluster-binding NifX family protein